MKGETGDSLVGDVVDDVGDLGGVLEEHPGDVDRLHEPPLREPHRGRVRQHL